MDKGKKDEVKHGSGAKSSHFAYPYEYIRLTFMQRTAMRFKLGEKYGRGNWLRAYSERDVDIEFLRDRYRHAVEHLRLLGSEGSTTDDHIGAVAWFLNIADEAESMGLNWGEIMRVVSPEEEADLRARIRTFYKPRKKVQHVVSVKAR